ncbi:copper resistance CopC family protein [Shouchella hunanensis]|uniref:Copper resistance protein CopC n=1 Tax=Shouchella hunanensis TaxID=766894 RepID=A0ABY7W762_9BACI|nr:copper resistance protein CopC [Shouchella hunanensis]WDF03931.1 copper resistance protein CopC [Shouchella hunanensis]
MKRSFTSFLLLLTLMLALPNLAQAHSHQESSSPEENEEVTAPLDEITVTFDSGIASGNMTVTNNTSGEEVEPDSVDVESNAIIASFSEPLQNGEYVVYWENIGDDTHHIDGEFTFVVNVEEEGEEESAVEEDITEEESTDEATEQETDVEQDQSETETAESGSAVLWISIILAILFIGGLIGFIVSRKKKN